jgi:capsular polysaccharide biosynthesis protein
MAFTIGVIIYILTMVSRRYLDARIDY